MRLTIIQSSLCSLIHSALFIKLAYSSIYTRELYDNGKWKMLQNEVSRLTGPVTIPTQASYSECKHTHLQEKIFESITFVSPEVCFVAY
jgi:hypothetical protein